MNSKKGFSLVELIVVIAIMAILVGVAVPTYTAYINKANEGVDEQLAGEIEHAIETLLVDPKIPNATKVTVDVDASGALSYTVTANEKDTTGAFAAALTGIIDVTKVTLKSTKYANGFTFTITAYACDWAVKA